MLSRRNKMSKVFTINESVENGLRELLSSLLKNKKIRAVFALKKMNDTGAVSYHIFTNADELTEALPFYPIMPANAAQMLSRFTLLAPSAEPIAVLMKPCELRALIELGKRQQAHLENLLVISTTCGGVLPLQAMSTNDLMEKLPHYWEAIKKSEIPTDIRATCKACEHFVPYNADIIIPLLGNTNINEKCEMFLQSDKAEKMLEDVEGKWGESELRVEELEILHKSRAAERKKLFENTPVEDFGMSGLINTFGRCIGCHACSKVCPICYCGLCHFESETQEYKPPNYEKELQRKNGLRVPPGTIFFQLGRLIHMSISCVGCGQCSDVCPADIPVSTIFSKVGESVQKLYDYLPGKNLEQTVPISTFEREEFKEIGE
jgi:formate dehydrogenase subunit beta